MSENMKKKLSSRKLWALIVGFVSSMLLAFNFGENQISQITAIISSFGLIIVYILSEASIDKASIVAKSENTEEG